ncbi:MAG: tetratricopeptide repeat protein [Spirochaetes bacterium]|nr:tetratricopeptide repeat protein [Spirochaetota bacterium]
MKKAVYIVIFFIIATAIVFAARFFNCGNLRERTTNSDKKIEELKKKIAGLEEEKIKDARAMSSLANNYTYLGTLYVDKRLWDQAIDCYEKGISYGKDTPGVYYSIGLAYGNRGADRDSEEDIDKAERYYRKAIAMQNDYSDAQNALAILLYYHKNKKDEALSLIEEVVGRNKKNYLARFTQARFYYEMDKLPRALSLYEDLNAELEKLPPSQVKDEYMKNSRDNIQRIMMEIGKKRKSD